MNINYKLYLVTDREVLEGRDLLESVEQAILGGVTLVQLREKATNSKDFYNLALQVKELTHKYNIPLIINDRLDIALAINADGLHIGQEDLPISLCRKLLGKDKILGVSAHNLEEALEAESLGADYLGVGAIFSTSTKKDVDITSIDTLIKIKENVKIPVVAIGGITHDNVKEVLKAPIDGVSVVSCLLGAEDIKKASTKLNDIINS
ncbi:thiamine phosphate synthase [Desnuesiella massiliensis]|uniref:thiamine phosphate synthase n=1 Tax=Desnuesiella massiliensis TaxID=1650662 RepID=UPI0006E14058|nr:thiamine phosphate synthase [Desnuesiella massiliensis]